MKFSSMRTYLSLGLTGKQGWKAQAERVKVRKGIVVDTGVNVVQFEILKTWEREWSVSLLAW